MISLTNIIFNNIIGLHIGDDLKAFVNDQINSGIFHSCYDIAVKNDNLNRHEIVELLESVIKFNSVNNKFIGLAADEYRNYIHSTIQARHLWVDNNNIIISNGIKMKRLSLDELNWETLRISWDGLEDIKYIGRDRVITGNWYQPPECWSKFIISYDSGNIIEGQVMQW